MNPGHTQTRCRAGGTSGTRYRASSKWQAVHRSSVVSWMGSAYDLVLSIDQDYEEGTGRDRYKWDVTMHGPIAGINFRW